MLVICGFRFQLIRLPFSQDWPRLTRSPRTSWPTSRRTCTTSTTSRPCPSPGSGPRRRKSPAVRSTRLSCRHKLSRSVPVPKHPSIYFLTTAVGLKTKTPWNLHEIPIYLRRATNLILREKLPLFPPRKTKSCFHFLLNSL